MRVAFDIGGTFTDVIVLSADKRIQTAKVLSLLDRVGDDIVACIKSLNSAEPVENFVHATTIASNAVIERQTAPTALITTTGFRDVLELMNQKGHVVHDIEWERILPLIPRHLCFEVNERILADGSVERPLDRVQAQAAIVKVLAAGVEAVAVCLINSYVNQVHELELGRLIKEAAPELTVCLSGELHPESREYERTSTTVINASLVPVVNRYLDRLEQRLSPYSKHLLIMQSNGGTMTSAIARQRPMYMIESGPAAGVLAAARLAAELGLEKVLSFDMGGTTVKACLIQNGKPLEKAGGEIGGGVSAVRMRGSGYALRVPSIDIVEVGAGGGSIAWIDAAGGLRAGPISASADPGPVCYGRGGREPTVTDANVALGFMNPQAIAGSALKIDRQAALDAIRERIAEPLKLEVMSAAYGITQVANATMMRALRAVSTERGHDIRDLTLIAFGGAGPIHAAELCDSVGIRRVIVPTHAGLFSALGLLLANNRLDYLRSVERSLAEVSGPEVAAIYQEMEDQACQEFASQGIPAVDISFERNVDLRIGFDRDEMTLPCPPDANSDVQVLDNLFRQAHQREFGFPGVGQLYIVNLRVRVLTATGQLKFSDLQMPINGGGKARATRQVYFGGKTGSQTATVLARGDISHQMPGPLIIEEPDTTAVVPSGWTASRDRLNNIVLTRQGRLV